MKHTLEQYKKAYKACHDRKFNPYNDELHKSICDECNQQNIKEWLAALIAECGLKQ